MLLLLLLSISHVRIHQWYCLLALKGGRKGAAVLCELIPGQLREEAPQDPYGRSDQQDWYRGREGASVTPQQQDGVGRPGYPAYDPSYGTDSGYPEYSGSGRARAGRRRRR